MSFHYQVPKRYTDLDAGHVVDHGVVIDYLQESRTEFLFAAGGPMPAMLDSGVLVTAHQVEYLAPITAGAAVVDSEVWVDQVGGSRFSISYELVDADRPVVRARTFLAPYDLREGALRRLNATERDLLTSVAETPVQIEPLGRVGRTDLDHSHHSSCRVRWADLDSYRHVNNVRFFDYFHQAGLELVAPTAPLAAGLHWRVLRRHVDYRLPIDFRREPYRVRTAVTEITDDSCALVADLVDPCGGDSETGARPFATSRCVLAATDEGGRRQELPKEAWDALERWRMPSAAH